MKYFYFLLILLLTSCVEIIEDLKLNLDGSGTFKYTLNLSSSKTKVKSFLFLDSLDGKKVLKENEIKEKIKTLRNDLLKEPGITKVLISEDYENYVVKFEIDFKNVDNLENGLKNVVKNFYPNNDYDYDWVSYNNKVLIRNIPSFSVDYIKTYPSSNFTNLNLGSYTSILRFPSKVDTFTNLSTVKSKSGMAIMVKVTPDEILKNQNILNNKINLEK
jgi:hypothetical protein